MGNINSLEDLFLFLRRFWLLIVGVTIVGSSATVWYALQQPHVWEAAAVVRVETPSITTEDRGVTDVRLSSARLQQIEQDLLSRDAALEIISRYRLFADMPALSIAEQILLMRMSVQFMPMRPEGIPFGPEQPITSIVIFSRQGSPETAAAIANELAERMVNLSSERQSETVQQAKTFFAQEEQRIAADTAALDAEVTAYKNANIDALPEGLQNRRDRMARLDDEIRAQNREISTLEQELAVLRERRNPRAVELRQIEALETQIGALVRARESLEAQRDQIAELNTRTPVIEGTLITYARRQQQLDEQLAATIRRRIEAETTQRLTAQDQTERFELLETALPPEVPLQSKRRKLAAMGLIGSIGLGAVLAFVLDLRNPALRTSAQFERATQIRPVISIPPLGKPRPTRRGPDLRRGVAVASAAGATALVFGGKLAGLARAGIAWLRDRRAIRNAG